ncbi:MAG: hypothetical protein V4670_11725 [Bacteroidota bacterium]
MQKRRLNIILLLVVLGLWSTVAYKSLYRFFPSDGDVANENFSQNFNFEKIEKDTFLLEKLNRDPFLDKAIKLRRPIVLKSTVSSPKKAVVAPKPTVNSKPILEWPKMNYYGYIKSNQKTEELILVRIDNKLVKVRKNQNIEGVVIKHIFKDSIEVIFNKEKKFIYIK